MRMYTLAHLSDLHIGLSEATDRAARELCETLARASVDCAIVTGDITHHGTRAELDRFYQIFAPLAETGRLVLIPGNHDRWQGDHLAHEIMGGTCVDAQQVPGLYVVRVDSSGSHNRSIWLSHGNLSRETLGEIEGALLCAPPHLLRVVVLHHHPLPLPAESFPERLAARIGWPYVGELGLGPDLLERVHGLCDLVLHGHRHVPRAFHLGQAQGRTLDLFNAGSSTALGRFRLFHHMQGMRVGGPQWLDVRSARTSFVASLEIA